MEGPLTYESLYSYNWKTQIGLGVEVWLSDRALPWHVEALGLISSTTKKWEGCNPNLSFSKISVEYCLQYWFNLRNTKCWWTGGSLRQFNTLVTWWPEGMFGMEHSYCTGHQKRRPLPGEGPVPSGEKVKGENNKSREEHSCFSFVA
jgi:hypothetical protein